jgi:hypothetical protein
MNRDDVIRMAREAGFEVMDEDAHHYAHITDTLCNIDTAVERFAALVAAHEREQCAKVCDELGEYWAGYKDTALLNGDIALSNAASGEPRAAEAIAKAIRARGEQ